MNDAPSTYAPIEGVSQEATKAASDILYFGIDGGSPLLVMFDQEIAYLSDHHNEAWVEDLQKQLATAFDEFVLRERAAIVAGLEQSMVIAGTNVGAGYNGGIKKAINIANARSKDVANVRNIVINGNPHTVFVAQLSYEAIVILAGLNPEYQYTVVYQRGIQTKPEGTVIHRQSVDIVNGMRFNVAYTGDA